MSDFWNSLKKLVEDLTVDQTHFYDILDIVIIKKGKKERPKSIEILE